MLCRYITSHLHIVVPEVVSFVTVVYFWSTDVCCPMIYCECYKLYCSPLCISELVLYHILLLQRLSLMVFSPSVDLINTKTCRLSLANAPFHMLLGVVCHMS